MQHTPNSIDKLKKQKRDYFLDEIHYAKANSSLHEETNIIENDYTENELFEILGDLRELTIIRVTDLLCGNLLLIKSSQKVLVEIAKVNEKLLNELGYNKVIFEDGVSVKSLNRKRNYYF